VGLLCNVLATDAQEVELDCRFRFDEAILYLKGNEFVARDSLRAVDYLKPCVEAGDSNSQLLMGRLYLNGNNPDNYKKGFRLVKEAAKQGNEKSDNFEIKKGSWLLGGSIGHVNENSYDEYNDNERERTLDFSLEMGYAFDKNNIFGMELHYNNSDYIDSDYGDSKYKSFGMVVFVRRYFSLHPKLAINLQGEMGFHNGDIKGVDVREHLDTFVMGIRSGLTFLLTEKIALKTTFGFLGHRSTDFTHVSDFYEEERYTETKFTAILNFSQMDAGIVFML
jgi:hypothetical protein